MSLGFLQPQWKTAVSAGLLDSTSAFRQGDLGESHNRTEICEVCPGLGFLQPQWKTAVSAGLLDSTSVFCQGDLGSNPIAGTEIWEVCVGLGIL